MYKLRVSKVPPEFWEEANQALLLWEQGTEATRPDYLEPIRWPISVHEYDNDKRLLHTCPRYYIGMLLED